MSDCMICTSFEVLLKKLLKEYKEQGSLMGVPVERTLDKSPIGPAAGPHTQLAGNIVAAYAAGASHFELKTVQILEGKALGIKKPCIYTGREVYNTEWSTELTVDEALDEYIKAYLLLNILIREYSLGNPAEIHFVMSVGYDLDGIQSKKINGFIESMKDAKGTQEWQKDLGFVLNHMDWFQKLTIKDVDSISPCISNTMTLSTMHGCKSHEIEAIARYLLQEKQLNTYIKMNPTLLGAETIKQILDHLNYRDIAFEDSVFQMDLDFETAVSMLERLMTYSKTLGREFGVKLTNTFPVKNRLGVLEGETTYLSGPALFPISIGVAAKLATYFEGRLKMSFSGGADADNIEDILMTGIYPVTVSSILLQPGGYRNLTKMNRRLEKLPLQLNLGQPNRYQDAMIDVEKLVALAHEARTTMKYANQEPRVYRTSEDYEALCASCKNCVDVCPNRANVHLTHQEKRMVIHLDDLCNECGNCVYFCIKGHKPYLEKWTLFSEKDLHEQSSNPGVVMTDHSLIFRHNPNADTNEKSLCEELSRCLLEKTVTLDEAKQLK